MTRLLMTAAVLAMVATAAQAEARLVIPKTFHGIWCPDGLDYVKSKKTCDGAIRVYANSYTHKGSESGPFKQHTTTCSVGPGGIKDNPHATMLLVGKGTTLIVSFVCDTKPEWEIDALCFMRDRYTTISSNVKMCYPREEK